MINHSSPHSFSIKTIQVTVIIIISMLILTGSSTGQTDHIVLRSGISYPGEIPDFTDFNTDNIVPGTTGSLKFNIRNRYTFNIDNNMTNVVLKVNIYRFVTLEESKDVSKISDGPKITGGNSALVTNDQYTAEFRWDIIRPNETVPVELTIKSSGNSPEGTYFVRMHLNFSFNGTSFDMKSRGHFSDDQWDRAQPNATEPDGAYNGKFIIGRLDLNVLEVDGVIPDTSIRIKEPIPLWPFYVLVIGAILFLFMGFIFYLMDEKGKFPRTKKKLDDFGEKVNNFRYRRE